MITSVRFARVSIAVLRCYANAPTASRPASCCRSLSGWPSSLAPIDRGALPVLAGLPSLRPTRRRTTRSRNRGEFNLLVKLLLGLFQHLLFVFGDPLLDALGIVAEFFADLLLRQGREGELLRLQRGRPFERGCAQQLARHDVM